jgi:hypothetical protein
MTTLIVSPPVGLEVYQATRRLLAGMLGHAQQLQASIAANSILSSLPLNLLNDCIGVANFATTVGSNAALITSILALYSADQQAAGSQQTPAQCGVLLNSMFTATTSLAAAIQEDYPQGAGNFLEGNTFGTGGVINLSTFTASQFPNTATALTAWLATVS